MSLRGLTLHRPWPWAIFDLPPELAKDVENRDWYRETATGILVAIHAGQTVADKWRQGFAEKVSGRRPPQDGGPTGIVGVVRFGRAVEDSASPWFVGRYGWPILERWKLPEVLPCRGAQQLWRVPPGIEQVIRHLVPALPRR